ncbi:ATP-binding cassette sub-family A member 13-like [Ixodes scapularis]
MPRLPPFRVCQERCTRRLLSGTASPIVLILLRLFSSGLLPRWIPMFLPPVVLPGAIYKLMKLEMENDECLRIKREYIENITMLEVYCQTGFLKEFGYGFERCCEHAEKGYAQGFQLLSPFELGLGGIVFDIVVMLLEGALFFALLVWRDTANFLPTLIFRTTDDVKDVLDSEVQAEKDLVRDLCSEGSFSEHALVAHNVHKFYGHLHAVRGLNFAVVRGECFGLLGVNGAGKTTTFQVLTALEQMTDGDAYMQDGKLSEDPRRWQSHIGYCLQSGGLLEQLNAYQFLRLFAILRGVKRNEIKRLVNSVISIVGLKQYAKKKCGSYRPRYSGGPPTSPKGTHSFRAAAPRALAEGPFARSRAPPAPPPLEEVTLSAMLASGGRQNNTN